MDTLDLTIGGMTCAHCVNAVRHALEEIDGVTVPRLSVGAATVAYDPAGATTETILEAITAAGYAPRVGRS
ncbi:MAG: cation transporter [Gemmatimonadaceae bacterium]